MKVQVVDRLMLRPSVAAQGEDERKLLWLTT